MNRIRILSVLMILALATLSAGCMGGGGGSSTPVEKDVVGITSALRSFMSAVRTGDQTGVASLLTSPSESYIIIRDFGSDIRDPNDDVEEFYFYVNPDYITQPSTNIAFVRASYALHNGSTLWLTFSMVRDQGNWLIENIETGAPPSDSPSSPHQPPPSSFVVQQYFPLTPSIQNYYALINPDNTISTARSIKHFYSPSLYEDNIYYSGLYFMSAEKGDASYESTDYDPSPGSLRGSLPPFIEDSTTNPTSFGFDSAGALWYRQPGGFYESPAFKLFEASHEYGSTHEVSLRLPSSSGYFDVPATVTIVIGQPQPLVTPLKTYSATVKVTMTTQSAEMSEPHKWALYMANGVGIVGVDHFSNPTSAVPSLTEQMLMRIGDSTNTERADPQITTPELLPGEFVIGANITINLAYNALNPRFFLTSSSSLPDGLTLDQNTGVISGVIVDTAVRGEWPFTVAIVDRYYRSSEKTIKMNVVAAQRVSISPALPSVMPVDDTLADRYILFDDDYMTSSEYSVSLVDVSGPGTYYLSNDSSGRWTFNYNPSVAGTLRFKIFINRPSPYPTYTSHEFSIVVDDSSGPMEVSVR
jgi:hypothetical protein